MGKKSKPTAAQAEKQGQLLALGTLISWLMEVEFRRDGIPKKWADAWRARAMSLGSVMTFDELSDAALSDVAAQQYRETLVSMVDRAEAAARGVPLDQVRRERRER